MTMVPLGVVTGVSAALAAATYVWFVPRPAKATRSGR
jgi:hypothetical protein